jgi:hypothetical protein
VFCARRRPVFVLSAFPVFRLRTLTSSSLGMLSPLVR